jgi:hypothetical protein
MIRFAKLNVLRYLMVLALSGVCFSFESCKERSDGNHSALLIGYGQMPNMAKDQAGRLRLAYGSGDSIMYTFSSDLGKTFSPPVLVATLPHLFSFSMRGPQIAVSDSGLTIIACSKSGNIYSYRKTESENWSPAARVNDADTIAKEGLMALGGDGKNIFAVWLDIRDKHNKIFGAGSTNGGKSWTKNIMVYTSPDSSVCECCKPSVVVKGNHVYVMFRNWLKGNRDLYLIQSDDMGSHFNNAEKLGMGSWALNGCPMDGGGLALNQKNIPQTVWRRQGTIYSCEPGQSEKELGEGRSCTMESFNNNNIYSWTEKGEVFILKPNGHKISFGKGQLPVIKAADSEHAVCVWENENQIYSGIVDL